MKTDIDRFLFQVPGGIIVIIFASVKRQVYWSMLLVTVLRKWRLCFPTVWLLSVAASTTSRRPSVLYRRSSPSALNMRCSRDLAWSVLLLCGMFHCIGLGHWYLRGSEWQLPFCYKLRTSNVTSILIGFSRLEKWCYVRLMSSCLFNLWTMVIRACWPETLDDLVTLIFDLFELKIDRLQGIAED